MTRTDAIRSTVLTLAISFGLALPSTFASATDKNNVQEISATEFVLGNVAFAVMHELAHLLISEYNVPILGSEESAADQIATVFLVRGEGSDSAQTERLRQYADMTALAFAVLWDFASELDITNPYWDDHGLSIQRYYRVLCLIHGNDPNRSTAISPPKKLPEERAQNCAQEFARANRAVEWLLTTYGAGTEGRVPLSVKVAYEPPRSKVELRMLTSIRERQLIELIVEAFQQRFSLQREFQVTMQSCGRPEAIWRPDSRDLVICYELLDAYQALYLRASN